MRLVVDTDTPDKTIRARSLLKQNMDFNLALKLLSHYACHGSGGGKGGLFMVAEDDFHWCREPARWDAILGLARGLEGNFSAIKLSYGNNGLVMQCRDLLATRVFMEAHTGTWPIDALLAVFTKGDAVAGKAYWQDRPYVGYRYMLGEHLASYGSTLHRDPAEGGEKWPKCMEDITRFKGGLGATAHEFATGLPAGQDFGFLRNGKRWTNLPQEEAKEASRRAGRRCFRPVVVNVGLPGVPHSAFDQAKVAFQGTPALFLDAHSVRLEGVSAVEEPAWFWQNRRPEIESITLGNHTFVKRPLVTPQPDVRFRDSVETNSPHRISPGKPLPPNATVEELALLCQRRLTASRLIRTATSTAAAGGAGSSTARRC